MGSGVSVARLGLLGRDASGGGDTDVACEPDLAHGKDDEVADVELPPLKPVTGAGGECVVVVVPAFAQTEHAEDRVVAALVVAVERA